MTIAIRPSEPDRLPDFVGTVDGIDLSRPLGPDAVAAITAGMDRFADRGDRMRIVLVAQEVFHGDL